MPKYAPDAANRAFLPLLFIASVPSAHSASVYVGYGQSEQMSILGERTFEFDPAGVSALVSVDLTENLSLTADVSALDDSTNPAPRVEGDFDIDSWSVGLGYYLENWSFSASFSDWEDSLVLLADTMAPLRVEQNTDAPSISVTASYDWGEDNWQMGVSTGIHYSDWEQNDRTLTRDNRLQTSVDNGDSTFVSVTLSAARFVTLSEDFALIVGGSAGWNQLTDSESTAVSRNGRNISQINNRVVRDAITGSAAIGSESYGQVNLYLSLSMGDHWVLDLNTSSDVGGDENSTAWSANLGYQF